MRVWGRQYSSDGTYQWVAVTTDSAGFNSNCYLTALCQAIKLNLGESPFYSNTGIPQQQTILTQVNPDFYVQSLQQQYAQYFATLTIVRVVGSNPPQYNITALCPSGAILNTTVAT
ncbi:hypothetical protein [Paraburkholderia acidisoli]|uniref:Uncharacterized protein n=1 Tax=Paraburkholderia acidisoli TaxID=2571748 RepID=A0A7Z2JJH9_9BURK|nr:hypothetical protein [Paraburkholderia acidisoli]QGZ66263.1 hypothetical protein FAZ98_31165 [Paraburkholderia acidisoli]QGZ66351.1 hypothetical protein FAZ98_31660 [Paraburkholderia acidisoli]